MINMNQNRKKSENLKNFPKVGFRFSVSSSCTSAEKSFPESLHKARSSRTHSIVLYGNSCSITEQCGKRKTEVCAVRGRNFEKKLFIFFLQKVFYFREPHGIDPTELFSSDHLWPPYPPNCRPLCLAYSLVYQNRGS